MFFKLAFWFLLISSGFLYAQDWEFILSGRVEDLKLLPAQVPQGHEFTFTRLIYNGRMTSYYKNWYTDYPKADRQLIEVVRRFTSIDIAPEERAIPLHHPDLFSYPFIYSAEGGQIVFDEKDAKRMREYIDRGGFWMIDDFWGSVEWENFEKEIKKVFPEKKILDIPSNHSIFHCFYDIERILQVPVISYAYCQPTCPTWEEDGFEPYVRGIFDDKGNLVVFINFNTDLMDAVEWADDPKYPLKFSAYAYKIFINTIVYTMTH